MAPHLNLNLAVQWSWPSQTIDSIP